MQYLADKDVTVAGIVTQPDRPKGRSNKLQPSPVKQVAEVHFPKAQILQPEKASNEEFLSELRSLQADLFVVVAFGQILPQKLLSIPPKGCINIHTSLLPKLRGAAPIQRAIMLGEKQTGVAIQKMVYELDAGDVIATAKVQISSEMSCDELQTDLCELAKPLLVKVLEDYSRGIPEAIPQDHSCASYAAKIGPEDREINWNDSSVTIHNQIRGLAPKPGAWTWLEKPHKRMKILKAQKIEGSEGFPGEILSTKGVVACGKGAIQIISVQPEGKKAMTWDDWFRGSLKQAQFY